MARRGSFNAAQLKMIKSQALDIVKKNPAISFAMLAEQVGVSKDVFSRWYREDKYNFKTEYEATLKEAFDRLEGLAIQCMGDLIVDGSFQAAKYVLDNKGYGATKKIEADVNSAITINVEVE